MNQTSFTRAYRTRDPYEFPAPASREAPTIEDAIQQYLAHRALRGSTQQSLSDLRRCLKDFRDWSRTQGAEALECVNSDLLRAYQRFVTLYRKRDGCSLATAGKLAKLVPLRSWLRWLVSEGAVSPKFPSVIDLPAPDQALPKRLLSVPQIDKVMATPRTQTARGVRHRTILELLYGTGIRRMELANLGISDIDLSRGIVHVRNGKGRKDRRIPMGPRAQSWLHEYLKRARPELPGAAGSSVVFPHPKGSPLHLSWISTIVSTYVRRSGVEESGACHLFRHSMATLMLDGGADIR